MNKELEKVYKKIDELTYKKALINEKLEPLLIRKMELENREIDVVCKEYNMTIREVMQKINEKKEKNNE